MSERPAFKSEERHNIYKKYAYFIKTMAVSNSATFLEPTAHNPKIFLAQILPRTPAM